jgi:hypothetical protein
VARYMLFKSAKTGGRRSSRAMISRWRASRSPTMVSPAATSRSASSLLLSATAVLEPVFGLCSVLAHTLRSIKTATCTHPMPVLQPIRHEGVGCDPHWGRCYTHSLLAIRPGCAWVHRPCKDTAAYCRHGPDRNAERTRRAASPTVGAGAKVTTNCIAGFEDKAAQDVACITMVRRRSACPVS